MAGLSNLQNVSKTLLYTRTLIRDILEECPIIADGLSDARIVRGEDDAMRSLRIHLIFLKELFLFRYVSF